MMKVKKINHTIRNTLSIPFIWGMIIPLAIFDIALELYHRICFPLYGLKTLSRKDYIKIDRHRLPYLNIVEKINCSYCGYANGLLHYASTIAAKSEEYWCSIQHENDENPPSHHKNFLPYGDENAFEDFLD